MKKLNERIKKYKSKVFNQEFVQISLYFLRIILAVVVMITLFTPRRDLSLIFFIVAIALGFIDYRRYKKHQHTQMESILNAIADKLLINLSAIGLYLTNDLPIWVLGVFLAKDLIFAISGFWNLRKDKYTVFQQTIASKITLFFQAIALGAILFDKTDNILLGTAVVFTLINIVFNLFQPEFKLVKRKEYDEFAFTHLLKFADFLTLINVFLGLLSIIFTINDQIFVASALLIAAVIFDVFDGKLARHTKTNNDFGKQLDSLADTVSFGVAPTVIGFSLIQTKLALIAFSIFLLCGILRLAKFNIMQAQGYYIGMPITINGIIIPLVVFFSLPAMYFPYLYLLLAILMVCPIQVKKKK